MRSDFILQALFEGNFDKDVLLGVLLLRGEHQKELFGFARRKREEYFPSGNVEVRSVIEVSNICQRKCNFCSISFYSKVRKRYVMKYEEILRQVRSLYDKNRRVFLLQSGENRSQKYIDFICKCTGDIKQKFRDVTLILCLGSLWPDQYRQLRLSGADRCILKFETSNPVLYKEIKPDDSFEQRIECLKKLNELGFEVGSGNIIGLPGQTTEDIVNDLIFIKHLSLKMVSTSIFIPAEYSEYRDNAAGDFDLTLNYIALLRILYPRMLIPCVSALERVREDGQYLGLMAGANTVTIHDGTPEGLKEHFPIYSMKRFTPNEQWIRGIVARARLRFEN